MSDQEQSTELVIPVTGEIVTLQNPEQVAQAMETLRLIQQQIREVQGQLTQALLDYSEVYGTKTLHLNNGQRVTIKGGNETIYDPEAIIDGLRQAGMPEERITEIVTETVTYKVKAVEAKKAASANSAYAEVIKKHSHTIEKKPSIEIK